METKTAPFLFRKIVYLKALVSFPNWREGGAYQSQPPEHVLRSEENSEALIIFRPPAIAYDQLIIDKGFRDGVREGALVIYSDYVLIGKIAEVFEDSSRVISFSSYGLEQSVFLEKAGISATALGYGNGEMIITLPRDFPAIIGDKAVSIEAPAYLVGIVERVESSPSSPLKTFIIKQPFNIYNLRSVNILK